MKTLVAKKRLSFGRKFPIRTAAAIVLCLGIIATSLIFAYAHAWDEEVRVAMHLNVSDNARTMGFNVGTDALWFGRVPPGAAGSRDLTVANHFAYPRDVEIRAEGNITQWITAAPSSFSLNPNEGQIVDVSVEVPRNATPAEYDGTLIILFRRQFP
ncbi:Uncharacterised protein [Candidatus Norongarragalina meridionalis]|nr:Uncharacterised protein [Candidatus Norongarragalina meridionalis]